MRGEGISGSLYALNKFNACNIQESSVGNTIDGRGGARSGGWKVFQNTLHFPTCIYLFSIFQRTSYLSLICVYFSFYLKFQNDI